MCAGGFLLSAMTAVGVACGRGLCVGQCCFNISLDSDSPWTQLITLHVHHFFVKATPVCTLLHDNGC